MPPTRNDTEELFPTATEPVCTTVDAPFGPVTVQFTVLMTAPPGSVRSIPTVPVPCAALPAPGSPPCVVPCAEAPGAVGPGDEHPTWAPPTVAALTAAASSVLRTSDLRTMALIGASPRVGSPGATRLALD